MSALITLTPFTVDRDDQLCSGGREPVPAGATAYTDQDGWVVCEDHSIPWAAGTDNGDTEDVSSGNPYDQWSQTPGGWDAFTDDLVADPEDDGARCTDCGHLSDACPCPHRCTPAED